MPTLPQYKATFSLPRALETDPPPLRQQDVDHEAHERLLTQQELVQQMGHAPKGNRLGGLWKMSTRYKAVQGALEEVNTVLKDVSPVDLSDDTLHDDLKGKLQVLVNNATRYIAKHGKSSDKQKKKAGAMKALINRATLAIAVIE